MNEHGSTAWLIPVFLIDVFALAKLDNIVSMFNYRAHVEEYKLSYIDLDLKERLHTKLTQLVILCVLRFLGTARRNKQIT
jgi:hypothetical protein